jgi:hypothetical protein
MSLMWQLRRRAQSCVGCLLRRQNDARHVVGGGAHAENRSRQYSYKSKDPEALQQYAGKKQVRVTLKQLLDSSLGRNLDAHPKFTQGLSEDKKVRTN